MMENKTKQRVPDEDKHMGEYLLWFIEEAIFNPKYQNWAGGRMEVHTYEDEFAIDEIRFFAPRNDDWIKFIDEYDGKWVDKSTLDKIIKIIKGKFYRVAEEE